MEWCFGPGKVVGFLFVPHSVLADDIAGDLEHCAGAEGGVCEDEDAGVVAFGWVEGVVGYGV